MTHEGFVGLTPKELAIVYAALCAAEVDDVLAGLTDTIHEHTTAADVEELTERLAALLGWTEP